MPQQASNKNLDFVVHHYQKDTFDAKAAFDKVWRLADKQQHKPSKLRRWVAVAASLLCIFALAAIITWQISKPAKPQIESPIVVEASDNSTPATASFHFDDTPLPDVLNELSTYYGVTLTASDSTRHLTGDFSGETLDDILSMIEEVLDVEIKKE